MGTLQLAGLVLGDTWQERMATGLEVTIIGMAIVFAVLILLYGILMLIGLFGGESGRPPKVATHENEAPAAESPALGAAPAGDQVQIAVDAEAAPSPAGDGELVAVIAAALAAATDTGPAGADRRRTQAVPAKIGWALAGRLELLTARERLPRG